MTKSFGSVFNFLQSCFASFIETCPFPFRISLNVFLFLNSLVSVQRLFAHFLFNRNQQRIFYPDVF
jgi:hypothetical protein